jgi:hypothetical protein
VITAKEVDTVFNAGYAFMANAASSEYQHRYPDSKQPERHVFVRHSSLKQIDAFMPPANFGRGRRNGFERRFAHLLKEVLLNIREGV